MSVHALSLLVDLAPARRAVGQVACFNASAMTSAVRCGATSGMRNTAPGIVTRFTLGAASRVARSASVRPPSPFSSACTTHTGLPDAASSAAKLRFAASSGDPVSQGIAPSGLPSIAFMSDPAPYLHLPGTARQALTFYGDVFGSTPRLHTFE